MNIRIMKLLSAVLFGLTASISMAADTPEESTTATANPEMSEAMQKSMDPNVWIKLMNSMMSGELQGQPLISSCVECHTDEDIARYQKDYGGMLQAMDPMMHMTNPQAYGGTATGMMAPMTGMMNPMTGMMAPMTGMMNPMTGMMAPMTGMMNPMTGMMAPMTGMMNPMTGMMAPMGMMMNPMTGMMMAPMMGMMNPMTGMGMMPGMGMPQMPGMGMPQMPGMGMPPMGMMPQMPGGMPPMGMMPQMPGATPGPQAIMDPEQYEKFYQQWQEMMSNMGQANPGTAESQ